MKDVYQSREKDVLLKQDQVKEADWFKKYEKEQIETSIAQQNAEFEARAAKEASVRKNHQMDILKQMNEERAAKLAELDYQRKITNDKTQNATMLS